MEITPLKKYAVPEYPIRPEIDARPEILRLLPRRWQANSAVVAALTACLAMSGCGKSGAADAPSRVAPIFEHGDGNGAFGCIAINPPVFLSEDEARNVIVDEAKRAGISFSTDDKVLPSVEVPVTTTNSSGSRRLRNRALTLDGYEAKHNIGFEYVSVTDFNDWKGLDINGSTVSSYRIIDAAKVLREGIAKAKPGGAYGVFYDPCVGPMDVEKRYEYHGSYGRTEAERKAEYAKLEAMELDLAREQLRAQVKDFIKWLKAQGVI